MKCLNRKDEDYDFYIEARFNVLNNIKNIDSKIITSEDFILPLIGVKKKLNKGIKEVKLLFRASRDGDNTQFHKKCDGVINTLTFVKATNGRKFGGFANKGWDSSNHYINDDKYGPLWGGGHDLYLASGCLSNNSSTTNQSSSYNYYGKTVVLSGGNNFQAQDYETYELILQ